MCVGGIIKPERKLRLPRERTDPLTVIANKPTQLPAFQLAFNDDERRFGPCADTEQNFDRLTRGRLARGQALKEGADQIGGSSRRAHMPAVVSLVRWIEQHDTDLWTNRPEDGRTHKMGPDAIGKRDGTKPDEIGNS